MMVQLLDSDILTREVLAWRGLHVFHTQGSSCSQKLRIFLNMKALDWHSHPVDLFANGNLTPFFLGINPRGLVPVLIDDGSVHIESNDILLHLEQRFPAPALLPSETDDLARDLLDAEDDLHLDLRTLSFRFMFGGRKSPKSPGDLVRYANTGSGMVRGNADPQIGREVDFWTTLGESGITDHAACRSAARFQVALAEAQARLVSSPYLLGERFSALDIAWIVYGNRLQLAGYPLQRLHPTFAEWLREQSGRPEIVHEIALPDEVLQGLENRRREQPCDTLDAVCFGGPRLAA